MREIRPSGLTSGEGKQGDALRPKPLRPSSTLPYGFRPGRGPHDALDALVVAISTRRVNYILDADIRSFFDSVSQDWLVRFVEHRIGDKRIVRLIRKWLTAGTLEGLRRSHILLAA